VIWLLSLKTAKCAQENLLGGPLLLLGLELLGLLGTQILQSRHCCLRETSKTSMLGQTARRNQSTSVFFFFLRPTFRKIKIKRGSPKTCTLLLNRRRPHTNSWRTAKVSFNDGTVRATEREEREKKKGRRKRTLAIKKDQSKKRASEEKRSATAFLGITLYSDRVQTQHCVCEGDLHAAKQQRTARPAAETDVETSAKTKRGATKNRIS